jgi:serine phosphatase RsbU (regulator of sigma subunit)
MSMPRPPLSTSRKVLLVLYAGALVLGGLLIAWVHTGELRSLKEERYARLGGVTGTLAAQISGDRVKHLLEKYDSRGMLLSTTQDAWYYVLHQTLARSAKASGLEVPIQIVVHDPAKQELQLVAASGTRAVLRERYAGPCAGQLLSYLQSDRIDGEQGTWGTNVASFDAIRNQRGAVVGVVIVEEPLDGLVAIARARLWRNIAGFALVFLVLGLVLYRSVGRMVQREEDARDQWQARHEGISDSIAYAGKIQDALIPRPERYREMFADHFILNRPKDVVSGDFHWYHKISEDECLVAAADCTGHGLPGAMLAAIGCSLLNELVVQHPHSDPAELLGQLNERLIQALNQNGQRRGAGDGMDIALCRIDRSKRELLFAGAFRPLYWMHDRHLTVVNGDRKPIGGAQHDPHRKFTVHRIAYHPGDRLYLFSDGYVDQFGGPERQKFLTRRLSEMLLAGQQLDMTGQRAMLEQAFLEWKGQNDQVDDVFVMGLEAA